MAGGQDDAQDKFRALWEPGIWQKGEEQWLEVDTDQSSLGSLSLILHVPEPPQPTASVTPVRLEQRGPGTSNLANP